MKRRRLWLMLFFIPVLFFALLFHFRERTLLERATILETNRPRYQDSDSPYIWLSDTQILFIDSTAQGYTARVRNIRTGQNKPYRGKGTFFGNRAIDDTIFRLSPDKTKLLWCSENKIIATDESGAKLGYWSHHKGEGAQQTEWMPDSLSWVEGVSGADATDVIVHHLDRQQLPEKRIRNISTGIFLGFTSHHILLTIDNDFSLLGGYQILECSLDGKTKAKIITLPSVIWNISEMAISPSGDKLAWISPMTKPDNFIAQWLGKLRFSSPLDEVVFNLWTSDIDGSNAKRIGVITSLRLDAEPIPNSLKWKPDGKQVSFYYGDKLYAVDVE